MGEHFCGSVITHYDTFILRLQSIVGSPRGMRLLREPWPLPTMHRIIASGMDTSVSVRPYCTAAVHSLEDVFSQADRPQSAD